MLRRAALGILVVGSAGAASFALFIVGLSFFHDGYSAVTANQYLESLLWVERVLIVLVPITGILSFIQIYRNKALRWFWLPFLLFLLYYLVLIFRDLEINRIFGY